MGIDRAKCRRVSRARIESRKISARTKTIQYGIIPIHVSKLLVLFGWYTGMFKSFRLQFIEDQLAVDFNLSELHKAHVLHHWRHVGIPMIDQQVKYAHEGTVVNCHLCNHPFRNLYEMRETGDEEKALFAAATRKHQTEADCVIGGIGSAAAVTKLQDALLSAALYVCFACAAPILSAHYQRREAQKMVQITTCSDTNATALLSMVVHSLE